MTHVAAHRQVFGKEVFEADAVINQKIGVGAAAVGIEGDAAQAAGDIGYQGIAGHEVIKGVEAINKAVDIAAAAAFGVGVEVVEHEFGAPGVGQVVSQAKAVGQGVVEILVALEDVAANHGRQTEAVGPVGGMNRAAKKSNAEQNGKGPGQRHNKRVNFNIFKAWCKGEFSEKEGEKNSSHIRCGPEFTARYHRNSGRFSPPVEGVEELQAQVVGQGPVDGRPQQGGAVSQVPDQQPAQGYQGVNFP